MYKEPHVRLRVQCQLTLSGIHQQGNVQTNRMKPRSTVQRLLHVSVIFVRF